MEPGKADQHSLFEVGKITEIIPHTSHYFDRIIIVWQSDKSTFWANYPGLSGDPTQLGERRNPECRDRNEQDNNTCRFFKGFCEMWVSWPWSARQADTVFFKINGLEPRAAPESVGSTRTFEEPLIIWLCSIWSMHSLSLGNSQQLERAKYVPDIL